MPRRPGQSGTGPGPIAPDGSAVRLYTTLPPGPDADIVHRAAPPGGSVLELGAGTGRTTRGLVAYGHPVVAVDESPEMLAHVSDAETVCAPIEDLDLNRTFDVVVLASRLVNVADAGLCRAMLRACRRHVADGGTVIVERHAPAWFDQVRPATGEQGGITISMHQVTRPSPDLVSVVAEYGIDGHRWIQSFTARRLDDADLDPLLGEAGMVLEGFLTPDRTWIRAAPVPANGTPNGGPEGATGGR